ncbi:ABC transporter, putative [Bodo saltans]|uniref:ABC transporter, putative n=1 Tax=Bodo saltans TaxID=75058 RepID=A0A0S4IYK6_BODSA|nr:ABC transporter, putative [Bodo saltans]|eukprot:CUG06311.1 ABC transporter, putative [Bodo saltans]
MSHQAAESNTMLVTHDPVGGIDTDSVIDVKNVCVTVNNIPLFKDAHVELRVGSIYGLMGPNGCGKSTILQVIANRKLPTNGSLAIHYVGHEQEFHESDLLTATMAVVQSNTVQTGYRAELAALQTKMGNLTDEERARLVYLDRHTIPLNEAQDDARHILIGLGLSERRHDRAVSADWRKRIALAAAMHLKPDVLFLDEPTNHLDLNAVIWLQSFLVEHYGKLRLEQDRTLVVVSHDTDFLQALCISMICIENHKLNYYYSCRYSGLAGVVEKEHQDADSMHDAIERKIKEVKQMHQSKAQIDEWLEKQIALGKIEREHLLERRDYVVKFPFYSPPKLRDANAIIVDGVSFNHPGCPDLFTDVYCDLPKDCRIALCGPSGVGKSTFLDLLTGALKPVAGHITKSTIGADVAVHIGRYSQQFVDMLPLESTCVEYILQAAEAALPRRDFLGLDRIADEGKVRTLLGSFGLNKSSHKCAIGTLSSGQKARVALAAISVAAPNFLLFDEPTNHLDLESIDALCIAIEGFSGGVVVVTHDARLIQAMRMHLWIVESKKVTRFPGNLEDYKHHVLEYVRTASFGEPVAASAEERQ